MFWYLWFISVVGGICGGVAYFLGKCHALEYLMKEKEFDYSGKTYKIIEVKKVKENKWGKHSSKNKK